VLPQTQIQYPVQVERQALGTGQYRSVVELSYGDRGSVQNEATFTVSDTQVSQLVESRQQQQLAPAVPTNGLLPPSVPLWLLPAMIAAGLFLSLIVGRLRRWTGRRASK
jgi:hypothetical protein